MRIPTIGVKAFRVATCALAVAMMTLTLAGRAQAFHAGGTGDCSGCHSVHSAKAPASPLLRQSDPSSVCLSCHQASNDTGPNTYHVATADAKMPTGVAPLQRTPAGDFGWLKKSYTYTIDGATITENGSTHGHNIVAADFGFQSDAANTTAPGGTFPAAGLSCTSCHDPHGKYRRLADGTVATSGAPITASGSYETSPVPQGGTAVGVYRLLAGSGYSTGGVTFTGVPAAVAPDIYNRAESATQTRVAYGHASGSGRETWARWCATCHPDLLSSGHAADKTMDAALLNNYAAYVKSGDMSGSLASSYLSLVPFVENNSDHVALASHAKSDDSALHGPASGDLVSCLTCHRAHATGWEHMLRWDDKASFIVYNGTWPGTDTTPGLPQYARGRTSAETQASYYDRPWSTFATYQRTLCNKCHARD
jgi:predicted CXXCH cytochrome family protein